MLMNEPVSLSSICDHLSVIILSLEHCYLYCCLLVWCCVVFSDDCESECLLVVVFGDDSGSRGVATYCLMILRVGALLYLLPAGVW